MASWRLTTRRRSEDFQSWAGRGPVWDLDGVGLRAPVFYHRADLFETIHLASLDAVQDVLPSDDLYPVRWFDGRALVLLAAYRYQHVSAEDARGARQLLTPYGEISVAVVVTRGKPRRRGLGLVQAMISGGGGFILDLPVTTKQACDGGRTGYGLPKFVADMDFTEEPGRRKVVLSEGETHILTLEVRTGGPVLADHAPVTAYSVQRGRLIETVVPVSGHRQSRRGAGSGHLLLGRHPVADRLRTLEVVAEPLAVTSYLDASFILPVGTPVGPARDYVGHLGRDRGRGRFTLSYPGTGPIDLYRMPGRVDQVPATVGVQQGQRAHA